MPTAALLVSLLAATVRVSVPLLLAALAGLYSERSGIVDVGLEGKMLAGCFAAAAVASVTGSAWAGLLAAGLAGVLLGLVHGYACITQRGDQVVSGMAINILAAGLTVTLGLAWFHQGGQTPPLSGAGRFRPVILPGTAALAGVPVLGPAYAEIVGGQSAIAYAAFALVPLSAWVLGRTRFGLRLRAVGESPAAVDAAGVSVAGLRYRAVLIAGALCGAAGAYISTAEAAGFVRDMTGGRGFIALAALILGRWRPWRTLGACLLFGFLDALAVRLQGVALPGVGAVPPQALQALPYVMTVVLLAGVLGRSVAPKAAGVPFTTEH